jgi:dienelactone hydrolase
VVPVDGSIEIGNQRVCEKIGRQLSIIIVVPGLWILGGRDKSIPVRLTMEMLDSLKAQGKDFTYIYYPDANHGLVDEDTHVYHPFFA